MIERGEKRGAEFSSNQVTLLKDYIDSFKQNPWETVSIPVFFSRFCADLLESGWWQDPQANIIEVTNENRVAAENFELNAVNFELKRPDGSKIHLRPLEVRVLYPLLAQPGTLIRYNSYFQPLRLEKGVVFSGLKSPEVARVYMGRLRQKMRDTFSGEKKGNRWIYKYIDTLANRGFIFNSTFPDGISKNLKDIVFQEERQRLNRLGSYLSFLQSRNDIPKLENVFAQVVSDLRQMGLIKKDGVLIAQHDVFKTADGLIFDRKVNSLTKGEVAINLSKTEAKLLYLLMASSGVLVTREASCKFVWGSDEPRFNDLACYIRYLRIKIKILTGKSGNRYIKCVPRYGHIFTTEVVNS